MDINAQHGAGAPPHRSGGSGGGSFIKKHKGASIAAAIGGAILLLTHRGNNASSGTSSSSDPTNPQATLVPVAVPSSTEDGTGPPSVGGDYNPTYVSGPVSGSSIGGGSTVPPDTVNNGDSGPTNAATPAPTSGGTSPPTSGAAKSPDKSINKSSVKDGSGKPPPSSSAKPPDKSINKSAVKDTPKATKPNAPEAVPNKGALAGHGGISGHAPIGQSHSISGHVFPGATGSTQTGQTATSTLHTVNYPGGAQHVEVHHSGPQAGTVKAVPKTPAEQRATQTPPKPRAPIRTTQPKAVVKPKAPAKTVAKKK